MVKYFKVIIFLLAMQSYCFAEQYYFEKLSVEQGLSQASVYAILEDRLGNLWFATESGGLNKYDGIEVTHYYVSNGLPDENIRCLFEDSKGRIWVGTENGGACYIENDKIITINIDNGLSDNTVNAITEGDDGKIWLGTENNGLNVYDEGQIKFFGRTDGLLSDQITALCKGSNGFLYIGTRRGLNVLKLKGEINIQNLSNFNNLFVTCILEDNSKTFWIGTNKGIYESDGKQISTETALTYANEFITSLYIDHHKNMWIGTTHGLYKKSADKNNHTTFFKDGNGLSNDNIKCILQDRSGSIWIGTKFGGVNKFIGEKFTSLDTRDGLSEQIITSLCVLPDSSIAYGSLSNGVTIKKGKKNIYLRHKEISTGSVNSLTLDNKGKLWIGTDGNGLFYFCNNKLSAYNDNISANEINCIFNDSQGHLWIGTKHRGIKGIYYDKGNLRFTELESLNLLDAASIFSFCEDHKGNIWCTSTRGIVEITQTDRFSIDQLKCTIRKDIPINGNISVITCFAEKNREKIWFGTQGKGIFFYHKNKFYPFPNNIGLTDLVINSMLAINDELWLGTDKNIKMISLNNFNIQTFSFTDGFEGIQCNRNSIIRDLQNNLWLGTLKGAYKIKVAEPSPTPLSFTPTLQLTAIRYNFNAFNWRPYCDSLKGFYKTPNRLELTHDLNHLTFDFKAIGQIHPESIEYKYKLQGHDNNFSPPSRKNEITYSNLEAGEYEFIVYSRLHGGNWNDQPVTLKITILAPFWETWWFRSLSVLSIILGIVLFYRWRTKLLKKEKIQLEKLVKQRTFDLESEKHKSEELLLNILPYDIAEELKISGTAKTKLYENASVMFTDFKGFTALSGQLTPEVLVNELNNIFVKFDSISDRHRLEKIKTIGDSYMCAGGIPSKNSTHAIDCVLAGFAFIDFINNFETSIGQAWEVRVGIHSGPIIAGVVGKKKFAYDIWGDSVNIASRMEANSEPGKLNISQNTYELIKDYFIFEDRGEKHVKNKGEMTMYFVERLKAEYSADSNGRIANSLLHEIMEHKKTEA